MVVSGGAAVPKFGLFEKVIMSVVTMVWAVSFFVPGIDSAARLGSQAAMMLVLGAVVGVHVTRKGDDK